MDPYALRDIQEEKPGQTTPLEPQPTTHSPPMASAHFSRPRRGSSASHVSVDHFDPQGVRELQRTLSMMSQQQEGKPPSHAESSSRDSSATLSPVEAPFDFEKALEDSTKRFVLFRFSLSLHFLILHTRKEGANIPSRHLGVVFEDLTVIGLGSGASYQETLGSTINPFNIIKQIHSARHPPTRKILSGFEGVVKPGEMIRELRYQSYPIFRTYQLSP